MKKSIIKDFLDDEEEIEKKTLNEFKMYFEIYESSFNELIKEFFYVVNLSKKRHGFSSTKDSILIIMPRIIQTLQSIRVLNLRGFYYDESILLRGLLESIGLCAYFNLNDKECENWIKGKNIKVPKSRLINYIGKLLKIEKTDFNIIYHQLSEFVHSEPKAIISFIDRIESKYPLITFELGPFFDSKKYDPISSYPLLTLMVFSEIFKEELGHKRMKKIYNFINVKITQLKDEDERNKILQDKS